MGLYLGLNKGMDKSSFIGKIIFHGKKMKPIRVNNENTLLKEILYDNIGVF